MTNYTANLPSGTTLKTKDTLTSNNSAYYLILQDDGNLCLYRQSDKCCLWASNTDHTLCDKAILHDNGNFGVFEKNTCYWQTATENYPGAILNLSDDGMLTLNHNNSVVWWAYFSGELKENQSLGVISCLYSPDRNYYIKLEKYGKLILYKKEYYGGKVIWQYDAKLTDQYSHCKLQSNGNLQLIDLKQKLLWQSATLKNTLEAKLILENNGKLTLKFGDQPVWGQYLLTTEQKLVLSLINPQTTLTSPNGNYKLTLQSTGNLELYQSDKPETKLWQSDTTNVYQVIVTHKGKMELYDADYKLVKSYGQDAVSGVDAWLEVLDNGKIAIYQPNIDYDKNWYSLWEEFNRNCKNSGDYQDKKPKP